MVGECARAESLYYQSSRSWSWEKGVPGVVRRYPTQAAVLRRWLDGKVLQAFSGRILPIDTAVARLCGELHVSGPRPDRDALIAATALVHGLTVATRNVADFGALGGGTLNPRE